VFGPPIHILLARAALKIGKPDTAETFVRDLQKLHPNMNYKSMANEILVEALCKQRKPEADPMLTQLSAKLPDARKPGILLAMAELDKHNAKYAEAAQHYRTLFLQYPASVEGLKATEELASLVYNKKVSDAKITDAEHLSRAARLYAKGRFDLSGEVYAAMLKRKPDDKSLKLKLARSLYKERQNQKAVNLLRELMKTELSGSERGEALYLLTVLYWRMDRHKDFEATVAKLIEMPAPHLKRKGLQALAAYHYEQRNFPEAENTYKKYLAVSEENTRPDIKWRLGWIKYHQKQFAAAAELFRETASKNGRIKNAARYWQARSLVLADKPKEAEPLLMDIVLESPLDYYAEESRRLLRSIGTPEPTPKNGRSLPDLQLSQEHKSNPVIAASERLMKNGLHEFAFVNLESLPKSTRLVPCVTFFCAKAAYGAGRHNEAVEYLTTVFGNAVENPPPDAPAEFIEIVFPRVLIKEVTQHSEKHSLDPNLVWAVMRQESRYDASAISPAGALGLMQVTPEAVGESRKKGRISPRVIEDLLEPKQNITHGIRILAKNLSGFNGRIVPAIAAYNADIRKVRDWVKKNEKMSQDEFIENIPYLETRIYVKKVLAGFRAYGKLHRQKDIVGFW
jgi:soluble lytic murein transglycosylase